MGFIMLLVFGIGLIAGPIAADVAGHPLGFMAQAVMTAFGAVITILAAALMAYARFYKKAKPNEALIRSGKGGIKVVLNGGCFVIGFLHDIAFITLETLRFTLQRSGTEGLLTKDKLRADIHVEFYVRVKPDEQGISMAAASIGNMHDHDKLRGLVENKLVDLLRDAAAGKTLEELISNRKDLTAAVLEAVKPVLEHNGLMFEGIAITKIDQADTKTLNPDNVNDAQGLKNAAVITQKALTEKNQAEREGEQARTKKDVETRQQILALQQTQAQAEAEQQANIAQLQAEQTRLSKEKEIETSRAIEMAGVAQQQAVEVAKRQKQQAEEVAEREKQQAITAAEQKVEVARREKERAIANAEAERAKAVAAQATAEALAEKERQSITTAQVQAEAERNKAKEVTMAEAKAQTNLIAKQKEADASAYAVQKDAEARKAAAEADAEAITKKAQAESKANELRAAGDRAIQMVPVDVQKAEVEVEQAKVNVLQQELTARAQHGQVAQEFEIAKLRITKDAEVRIAAAGSMAELMGSIKAQVFGTPEDVSKMTGQFMRGMGFSNMFEGVLAGAGPETAAGVEQAVGFIKALATKLGVTPEAIAGAGKVIEAPTPVSKPASEGNGKTTD